MRQMPLFQSNTHETWSQCLPRLNLTSLKMGQGGSKTRSLGQILETPCICPRGVIFSPVLMGHVRSKTRSLGQILDKPCVCSKGLIFSLQHS